MSSSPTAFFKGEEDVEEDMERQRPRRLVAWVVPISDQKYAFLNDLSPWM
jgi:hypothetical protein